MAGMVLYLALALFFPASLFRWTEFTGTPLSTAIFLLVGGITTACAFLAYACYKARAAGAFWTHALAVIGALLLGNTATANWKGALIFGPPFALALLGVWWAVKQKRDRSMSPSDTRNQTA